MQITRSLGFLLGRPFYINLSHLLTYLKNKIRYNLDHIQHIYFLTINIFSLIIKNCSFNVIKIK